MKTREFGYLSEIMEKKSKHPSRKVNRLSLKHCCYARGLPPRGACTKSADKQSDKRRKRGGEKSKGRRVKVKFQLLIGSLKPSSVIAAAAKPKMDEHVYNQLLISYIPNSSISFKKKRKEKDAK